MKILLFLCNATRIFTWILGWKIDHSELDQFEITCNKCGGLDECHCRSPEIYWNDFPIAKLSPGNDYLNPNFELIVGVIKLCCN